MPSSSILVMRGPTSLLGIALVRLDKLDEALASFKEGHAIRQALIEKDPVDARFQRDLSTSDDWIGDVLVKQGKLDKALASYQEALAIAKMLAEKDKANVEWQRDLLGNLRRIGDVLVKKACATRRSPPTRRRSRSPRCYPRRTKPTRSRE
jgi:tetratricopeptide (TPR) repeat protein